MTRPVLCAAQTRLSTQAADDEERFCSTNSKSDAEIRRNCALCYLTDSNVDRKFWRGTGLRLLVKHFYTVNREFA